jgi:hypothetical protein
MPLRGYSSSGACWTTIRLAPSPSLRGRTSPFPTVDLWHHLILAQSMVQTHIHITFNAQKTNS